MKSSYGKSNDKTGSISAFDFDLGLGSGRARSMNDLRNPTSSYTSTTYTYTSSQHKPNTTSSWTYQPNKPVWTHQPATSAQSGWAGSSSGPTSMVGDIFGKSWDSSFRSGSSASSIGILNSNNPNLFADLLSTGTGQKKNSNNVPLKNAAPAGSQNTFSMRNVANSLPKTGYSGRNSGMLGSNAGNSSGNVNLGGNYSKSPNLGGPSMKSMAGSGFGGGGIGSSKDPFGSLVDFGSKPPSGMNSASKDSDKSGLGNNSFTDLNGHHSSLSSGGFSGSINDPSGSSSKPSGSSLSSGSVNDPLRVFGFPNNLSENQSQPSKQTSGVNDFDALFSSTSGGGTTNQQFSEGDDWGMNSEFGGGNDTGGTTELEDLPPPPAGASAPVAKNKGVDYYKQGQFADAIKWLSWAVILLEKTGDDDGMLEVLTCRASCYKEVGEYKKAVADCTELSDLLLTLKIMHVDSICMALHSYNMLPDVQCILNCLSIVEMVRNLPHLVQVLEHDGKNVAVLVQRALLYESMEKYKLGTEDLRTVMNLDPGNRVARSTIHRLKKMAE
ncbi:UNVERIFIED_CONTAM: hypothetical protein Sangu_1961900 [Sesamum angustifolium]|uniref:Uncharacterized protein n=1 Tax=Sesamum angustifolium TaxID=2727405 RepID=A0AAW2M099_9LAMI